MVYADGKLYVGHDDGSELWVIDVKQAASTRTSRTRTKWR